MKLLIIRHGDPDYAHDSLTEKGFREADLLSEKLVKEKIDYFYCSPLGRAKRTAEPTMAKLGRTYEILDWAMEMPCAVNVDYTDMGYDFKGRISPWDLIPPYWTTKPEMFDQNDWRELPIFKESNVAERYEIIEKGFTDLMLRHGLAKEGHMYRQIPGADSNVTIALFCHMGFGNCLLSQLTGMPLPAFWHSFFLPTSSVTTVRFESFSIAPDLYVPRIVCLGDVSHLAAGDEPVSSSGLHCNYYG